MKVLHAIVCILLSVSACYSGGAPTEPEEIPTEQAEEILTEKHSIVDLALIYGGGAHRDVVWNKKHFAPYVTYTDRTNKEHWLFDGFLLLDFIDGKGKIFATGYYGTPATQNEWTALADYFFTSGQSVDALNKCIAEKIQTLGAPSHKRKIIIALPEPIVAGPYSHYQNTPADYWGRVDDREFNFTVPDDRTAACKWYIDYVKAKFDKGKFDHLELAGFYWIAEESLHTQSILRAVGQYLDETGHSFNWIPYWKEQPDYLNWKELGFHRAYLQPNYFFNDQVPYSRLEEACKLADQYELDLELEFDLSVFVNNGNRSARLYDYMKAFRQSGVLPRKRIAYYQDCDALYQLYRASGEKEKEIFHDFCTFVVEHQRMLSPFYDAEAGEGTGI